MTDEPEAEFTVEDAVFTTRALRRELGLGPEKFPLQAFVGMISDEIEQLRSAGKSDDDIAAMVEAATGKSISPDAIGRFYAPPEERHPHE